MKLFVLIISACLIVNCSITAQNLTVEQTLDYINTQLNEKDNKFDPIIYGYTHFKQSMDNYDYEVKIEHGLLISKRIFSARYLKITEEFTMPIKAIDNEYDLTSQYYLCGMKPARFNIKKNSLRDYSVTKITRNFNREGIEQKKKTETNLDFVIEFSNENLICDKLRNAFTYLIKLTSKNPRYNTIDITTDNDPFSNPILKDTTSIGAISNVNSNSIPMIKVGGVYEVPLIINGVLKLNFIFDAGASDVSISQDVALTLIRTGTVTDKDFLGTQTYMFADGSTAKSKVFIIKEIQLGNKKVNNIKASISNSLNAPLLLGQSALNKFGKVTIDYAKGVIVFQN